MDQPFAPKPIPLTSPEATVDFASALAPLLKSGDVLLLQGTLGAGKTHFARALIQTRLQQAGRMEDVPSPTFTLIQTYDDGVTEIWHADLYRLGDLSEIVELGLQEAFDDAISIIEWPDRLQELTPNGALNLQLALGDDDESRLLTLTADNPNWADRLSTLLP